MNAEHASIAGVAYAFPAHRMSVRELAAAGQLESDPSVLEEFGYGHVHVATTETPYELAVRAASALLTERAIPAESIDVLLYAGTPSIAFTPAGRSTESVARIDTARRFEYPATRLQFDLGLERAAVLALDQMACTSLFGAMRVANAMCIAGDAERVLCVSSEFFPSAAGREAIYNCTSDAACAVLVERNGGRNRIVASTHVTKGYYWAGESMRNEIVASYFPTSKHVVQETLRRAGWHASDVTWIMPHNVSARSWDILLGLIGIPAERLWSSNIARDGHTLAGDNFINLADAEAAGRLSSGDRVLLFSYGYGAHWTGLAVTV